MAMSPVARVRANDIATLICPQRPEGEPPELGRSLASARTLATASSAKIPRKQVTKVIAAVDIGTDLRMRIRIHDGSYLGGLVAFLEERDYVAEQVGPNTIEASRLSSVRHDLVRLELELHLRVWLVDHPGARAELLD